MFITVTGNPETGDEAEEGIMEVLDLVVIAEDDDSRV